MSHDADEDVHDGADDNDDVVDDDDDSPGGWVTFR